MTLTHLFNNCTNVTYHAIFISESSNCRARVTIKLRHSSAEENHALFLKMMPTSEFHKAMVDSSLLDITEIHTYKTLFGGRFHAYDDIMNRLTCETVHYVIICVKKTELLAVKIFKATRIAKFGVGI